MSTFEIKMPKLGESITEGTIVSWSVKVGDIVKEDSVLFEVNTAKVSAEIPAPVAGKIMQILFNVGDTVPVGTVVAIIDTDGENAAETPAAPAPEPKAETPAQPTGAKVNITEIRAVNNEPQEEKVSKGNDEKWYSPIVLQLAQENHIDNAELDSIKGTGYQGRLTKRDLNEYIEQKKKGKPAPAAAVPSGSASKPAPAPVSAPVVSSAPASAGGDVEIREMDRVRRIIADRMVMSKKTSPHVTNVVEVDVTKLVRWRDNTKEAFQRREGISLTYMPAITEAVAKALAEFPIVNSSVDGYNIILKKRINIGIAVSLNDGNLIVPVVHDADRLNLSGLAQSIDTLAIKARDNKLATNDIEGGTFTISNFGSFKSLFGTPIINQPEVAILGVGYIEKKPAVVETPEGDVIAIRHKMYLSLSFDHRVIDGSLGGKFLRRIADYLENWHG